MTCTISGDLEHTKDVTGPIAILFEVLAGALLVRVHHDLAPVLGSCIAGRRTTGVSVDRNHRHAFLIPGRRGRIGC